MLEPLDRLIELLARLPGVGRRSAERMALALVRDPAGLQRELLAALQDTAQRVAPCSLCGNITLRSEDPCRICTDRRRDEKTLCVVEDPADILLMERTGAFRGRYHALMGRLSPMRGEGVKNLRVDALLDRVRREGVQEVVLALNADVESDATASYLREALAGLKVKVTRPARGIPAGSGVAYTDAATLARAMAHREQV